jgi:hypothetical protein
MSSASPGTAATRALCIARAAAKVGPRPPLAAIPIAGVVAFNATDSAQKRHPPALWCLHGRAGSAKGMAPAVGTTEAKPALATA